MHSINQKTGQYKKEDDIDTLNINASNFNSRHSVMVANINTSSNQAIIAMPYKVDTGSNGNLMSLPIYKKLFPRATREQLAATRNKNIKLKTYNSTTIKLLDRCKVRIENHNKVKICNFFVVPRNQQGLLGMPDIETLGSLTINHNTIDTKEVYRAENCKRNTDNGQEPTNEQHYVNMRQENSITVKCCTNTDNISKLENKDKPMVTDNDNIEYFLPVPNSNINKKSEC